MMKRESLLHAGSALSLLQKRRVAIIGYGSQSEACARNLKESAWLNGGVR